MNNFYSLSFSVQTLVLFPGSCSIRFSDSPYIWPPTARPSRLSVIGVRQCVPLSRQAAKSLSRRAVRHSRAGKLSCSMLHVCALTMTAL